jgi:hypothetical protein
MLPSHSSQTPPTTPIKPIGDLEKRHIRQDLSCESMVLGGVVLAVLIGTRDQFAKIFNNDSSVVSLTAQNHAQNGRDMCRPRRTSIVPFS